MSDLESSGYRGNALNLLRQAGCSVGDIISVTSAGRTYEGTLLPTAETGLPSHIVIKLASGYNVGIHVTPDTQVKKLREGIKPAFAVPPLPESDTHLPRVAVISTGGTIASRVDYRTGAVRSALSASELYGVVPELSRIAQVETQVLFSLYSENITPAHWTRLAETVAEHVEGGVKGVVIAHGTDTMAYTAAALSFALQNLPVPVVLVGAQRSSDRPSSDAATNLIGAVKTAAEAPFAEVAVAMHETVSDTTVAIHRGTRVRKCHTSRRDAFKPVNASLIARVKGDGITMLTEDYERRSASKRLLVKPKFDENVALVKFHPGFNPAIIDWYVEKGCRGMILEGTGLGHVGEKCMKPIRKAVEHNVIVAMTSQCIWGRVNMNVYDTGRDLIRLGVIPLQDMFPETALVKMMWSLGQTTSQEKAAALLTQCVAREFSARTLPHESPEGGRTGFDV